jgi:2,5-dioxopentanoate dehydrogenase
MTETYQIYVDGEWRDAATGETFTVENPADTSEVVGEFQKAGPGDVEDAVAAAAAAQPDWGDTPGGDRGAILTETAELLAERKDELTERLTREEGKTHAEAGGEVQRAIDIFHYYGQKALEFRGTVKGTSGPDTKLYTVQEPVGVAALITPWNYPIAIPVWKLAPALAAGNAAVLKPASAAPGVAHAVFEALDAAGLPDGVANYVSGSGSTVAQPLIEHDDVDAVSFTGSSQVGESVYEDAALAGKRVQTEMGGKNPTIVSPSADLDEAVELVGTGAFGVTGQACTACSRAIVHEDVHDEFVDKIVEHAESIEVGPGDEYDMGPHVTRSELEGTLDYVEVGEREGATLETGGEELTCGRFEDGHFVSPAVFSGVESDMRLSQEEIFGPVLGVIEVSDFDEALQVANDVDYGLSASIVTNDYTEANRFIEEIEAGVAKVNDKTTGLDLHVPFGGFKRSSSETWREQGDAGLDFYTISKTVYENY